MADNLSSDYKAGQFETYNMFKKIADMSYDKRRRYFEKCDSVSDILSTYSLNEVCDIYKKIESDKEIKPGDYVCVDFMDKSNGIVTAVTIKEDGLKYADVMLHKGFSTTVLIETVRKIEYSGYRFVD